MTISMYLSKRALKYEDIMLNDTFTCLNSAEVFRVM